ncbi:ester cyclase [Modestobacter marinus]|uniref:ester cyclase n=1 Tax=Modestobacter marinus TaxID=477641 RepID=UPI001C953310|nr:ester cyclase [Modestobacter marinus]
MTTIDDVTQLVRDYGRLWDADAPRDLVDRVLAPEVVDHDPQPGQQPGREGLRQVLELYHAVFPDLRLTDDDVLVCADRAVLRWHATGTHEGDQLGIPATHREIRFAGIDIVRIEGGRVVERWGYGNDLQVQQQLS